MAYGDLEEKREPEEANKDLLMNRLFETILQQWGQYNPENPRLGQICEIFG